jgi:hypothetical protein
MFVYLEERKEQKGKLGRKEKEKRTRTGAGL